MLEERGERKEKKKEKKPKSKSKNRVETKRFVGKDLLCLEVCSDEFQWCQGSHCNNARQGAWHEGY